MIGNSPDWARVNATHRIDMMLGRNAQCRAETRAVIGRQVEQHAAARFSAANATRHAILGSKRDPTSLVISFVAHEYACHPIVCVRTAGPPWSGHWLARNPMLSVLTL